MTFSPFSTSVMARPSAWIPMPPSASVSYVRAKPSSVSVQVSLSQVYPSPDAEAPEVSMSICRALLVSRCIIGHIADLDRSRAGEVAPIRLGSRRQVQCAVFVYVDLAAAVPLGGNGKFAAGRYINLRTGIGPDGHRRRNLQLFCAQFTGADQIGAAGHIHKSIHGDGRRCQNCIAVDQNGVLRTERLIIGFFRHQKPGAIT